LPHEFIERKIIPYYGGGEGYDSLFGNRTYRIIGDLLGIHRVADYDRTTKASEMFFRPFAWTHVFKIAPKRGNPKVKLIKAQIDLNTSRTRSRASGQTWSCFFTAPGYDRHLSRVLFGARETSIRRGALEQVPGLEKELAPGGVAFRT
jgi:hypothetical protein